MRDTDGPEQSADGQEEADGWDAIVRAAGYDAAEDDAPTIYTGRTDDSRAGWRRLVDEPTLSSPWGQPHTARPDDEGFAADDGPLEPSAPAWATDDDVVLRAFEEHVRAEPSVPTPRQESGARQRLDEPEDIQSLLGDDANEIVRMAQASPIEGPAFEFEDIDREPQPWDDEPPRPAAITREETGWAHPAGYGLAPGDPGADLDYVPQPVVPVVMKSRRRRGRTVARELVETALLALLVFLAVRASFQNFKVDGKSMFPTLENGEFLIVNKLVYSEVDVEKLSNFLPFLDPGTRPERYVFHGPQRGDIVVLEDPHRQGTDLIKRVIGLPGETIEIVNGTVFINGFMLEEPYIQQAWHYSGPKVTIPEGEYFVMGDNRDNSLDSRSVQVGTVPKDKIIGKALLSYWPQSTFGLAPNGSPKLTDQTVEAWQAEHTPTVATPR